MASGGMNTLPHNGAVITLLAVTGLTHGQAYKDVFVITLTKTAAVFIAIGILRRRRHPLWKSVRDSGSFHRASEAAVPAAPEVQHRPDEVGRAAAKKEASHA
jgi:hypothetical protein